MPYAATPISIRFEAKYIPEPNSGCWLWLDYLDEDGYGQISLSKTKVARAHRVAYSLYRGEPPKHLLVCHTCDNPCCVNPDHLFLGTPKDNSQDMSRKGRYAHHKRPNPGELNGRAIINDDVALHILTSFWECGQTARSIADRLGLTYGIVSHVTKGRTWCHVPYPRAKLEQEHGPPTASVATDLPADPA